MKFHQRQRISLGLRKNAGGDPLVAQTWQCPRGQFACRVVVEPDVRNTAVHELNAAVGFTVAGEVELPDKRALLSFCTREDYEAAPR